MDPKCAIQLTCASRDVVDPKRGRQTVLRNVTATLPGRHSLSVLGPDRDVLSAFLHLLAGSDTPDSGTIETNGIRFSPIMNAGGVAGALVPQISILDNIHFMARRHGIETAKVARLVESVCPLGSLMKGSVRAIDSKKRRAVEVATIAALPYDCYLIDRLEILAPEFRWLVANSARIREAGMIFVTSDVKVARQFSTNGLIVEDGQIRPHQELRNDLVEGLQKVNLDG